MDPYNNQDNADLDKMAREVNNRNKKLSKQIYEDIGTQALNACVGMDCLMDPSNARFAPSNLGADFSFFSSQGDFSSGLPTPLQQNRQNQHNQQNQQKKKPKKSKKSKDSFHYYNEDSSNESNNSSNSDSVFTDTNSRSDKSTISNNFVDSRESIMDLSYAKKYPKFKPKFNYDSEHSSEYPSDFASDISSNYSSLPQKLKKQIRMGSNHLKKYKENDEQDILGHITKCDQCKVQLADLLKTVVNDNSLKNNNTVGNNTNNSVITNSNPVHNINASNQQNNQIMGLNMPELKDMLILLVIGIFIIIFVDIFIRR